jgi:prepilin-type N-terminal cleavage/methylation domain-containing protein
MFKKFNNQKKNGYTMVEIIVVMSIVGFIISAVWYSLDYSRKLARDTKRVADLSQIQKAIETFRNENGRWPGLNSDGSIIISGSDSINNGEGECVGDQDSAGIDKPGITPCWTFKKFEFIIKNFIQNIPADPKHNCVNPGSTADCLNSEFFYSYDPSHACGADTCPTLCFNKAESNKYSCINDNRIPVKDCTSGTGDMQQNRASYCILLK